MISKTKTHTKNSRKRRFLWLTHKKLSPFLLPRDKSQSRPSSRLLESVICRCQLPLLTLRYIDLIEGRNVIEFLFFTIAIPLRRLVSSWRLSFLDWLPVFLDWSCPSVRECLLFLRFLLMLWIWVCCFLCMITHFLWERSFYFSRELIVSSDLRKTENEKNVYHGIEREDFSTGSHLLR
jgi:hypothetical protein